MEMSEAAKAALAAIEKLEDADATRAAASLRKEMAKLAEANAHLRRRVLELEHNAKDLDAMIHLHNVYWLTRDDGSEDGPFCPKCRDGDRKPARMADEPGTDYWFCPVCQTAVNKPG